MIPHGELAHSNALASLPIYILRQPHGRTTQPISELARAGDAELDPFLSLWDSCLATGDLWSEQLYKRLCLSHGKCLWSCLNTQLYVKQLRLRAPFQGCPSYTLLHSFPLNSYSVQISTFLFHPVVLTFPFAPLPTLQLKNTSKYISYLKISFYSSTLDLHLSTIPSIFFLHSQGP